MSHVPALTHYHHSPQGTSEPEEGAQGPAPSSEAVRHVDAVALSSEEPHLVLGLWEDYGYTQREADLALRTSLLLKDDWREWRQTLIRDVKRKHRTAMKLQHAKRHRQEHAGLALYVAGDK